MKLKLSDTECYIISISLLYVYVIDYLSVFHVYYILQRNAFSAGNYLQRKKNTKEIAKATNNIFHYINASNKKQILFILQN